MRLQRYEMVYTGGAYSEHRDMQKVEPYVGQEFDESDEWCNAEAVFAMEAENARLREALEKARDELGVPTDDYPAPVASAVEIIKAALEGDK